MVFAVAMPPMTEPPTIAPRTKPEITLRGVFTEFSLSSTIPSTSFLLLHSLLHLILRDVLELTYSLLIGNRTSEKVFTTPSQSKHPRF
ncbi:unannotated protein [freshwater metagenome]|uniref:Unannotated protein n=1 Tax=freshwater metagenome TaxID=449393 RepID=A0A6J6L2L9_9ZZZZ